MPQLDILSYFSQLVYFYLFFVVLYFLLLLRVLPALVRNLKFREKAFSRLERMTNTYSLASKRGVNFSLLTVSFKKLNVNVDKYLSDFVLFSSFMNFYILKSAKVRVLNKHLFASFVQLSLKISSFA